MIEYSKSKADEFIEVTVSENNTSINKVITPKPTHMSISQPHVEGFIEISYKDNGEILLDDHNAIHYENFSIAIARAMAGSANGHIFELHLGNGGTNINGVGVITFLPPNVTGSAADLYNSTYYKVVNTDSTLNTDAENNYITVKHIDGTYYTDMQIVCTLAASEPSDQDAFDTDSTLAGKYVFDEIGLKTYSTVPEEGLLITHATFSPIQKSLNREIVIKYTVRISLI